MKKQVPKQVFNCLHWLTANKRFTDANIVATAITTTEKKEKLDSRIAYILKSLLEEYCSAHKIEPSYKKERRKNQEWAGFSEDHFSDAASYMWGTTTRNVGKGQKITAEDIAEIFEKAGIKRK